MSVIEGKEYPLQSIFSDTYEFHIPPYQRPYAWSVEQTGALFDDIYEFYQADTGDNYFLGTIVLIKKAKQPPSDVVDGQQRLTTLTILFSVIASQLTGEARTGCAELLYNKGNPFLGIPKSPRLHLRPKDEPFFEQYIQSIGIDHLLQLNSKKLDTEAKAHIQENCRLLRDRIMNTFHGDTQKILKFGQFLSNNCYLVVVSTDSQDSAFRVFSVMNDRGLDLLPIDIIKSDVIGKIPSAEQDKYTQKWEDLEAAIGRDSFNEVFTHTRTIYAKDKAKKTMLEEFRQIVMRRTTPKDLIDNVLTPYANAYCVLKGANYEAASHAEDVNNLLYWLNKISNSDWMPSAIKFFSEHSDDSAYTFWFVKKLERLASYLHVMGKNVNERMERYKKLLLEMERRPHSSLQAPLESIELNDDEKKRFLETLDGEIFTMPTYRRNYIIQRLDAFVADGAARYDSKVFTIEHVLPQNPEVGSDWFRFWPNPDERKFWLNRLGNLVPLTKTRNSSAGNKSFAYKKASYFPNKSGVTSYALTTQVVKEGFWTPAVVKRRQKNLLEVFSANWELGKGSIVQLPPPPPRIMFHQTQRGSNATGYPADNGDFVVLKGSIMSMDVTPSCPKGHIKLRNSLKASGIVVNHVFTKDYTFTSPSAAAGVVAGCSANGWVEWKTLKGRTLEQVMKT